MQYLGTANNGTRVCVGWAASGIKSFDDVRGKEVPFGAVSPNELTHDYAFMLRRTAGANYKVVSGYNGTTEIGLAMERGEVVGSCGWDWASVKAQRADWLRDKKLNVLLQIGLERNDELTKMGVPHVWDYVKSEDGRKVVELIIGQQVFQRSYIAPPEIPAAPLGDPAQRVRCDHEGRAIPRRRRQAAHRHLAAPGREGAGDRAEAARDAEEYRAGGARGDPALTVVTGAPAHDHAIEQKPCADCCNRRPDRGDRLAVAAPAAAQDYYAGKTIDLVVGNYPGGGFDIYARAVARHLGRHIPGNPTSW